MEKKRTREKTEIEHWCPKCKTLRDCYSVVKPDFRRPSHQWEAGDEARTIGYLRERVCPECYEWFTTIEVNEGFLNQLLDLEKAVGAMKLDIASFDSAAPDSSEKRELAKKLLQRLRDLN